MSSGIAPKKRGSGAVKNQNVAPKQSGTYRAYNRIFLRYALLTINKIRLTASNKSAIPLSTEKRAGNWLAQGKSQSQLRSTMSGAIPGCRAQL